MVNQVEPVLLYRSKNVWLGLTAWLCLCLGVGLSGSYFQSAQWYQVLIKPHWAPPADVYAPVWTLLYLLMGVAAWLVWKNYGFRRARTALSVFFLQLVLNALWTPAFFGLHNMVLALGLLILLWIALVFNIVLFAKIHRVAALLLLPYIAWVTSAGALNIVLIQSRIQF